MLLLLQPGDVVDGRFEIVRHAGFGGMGAVYRARDRGTREIVALKILFGVKESERFLREALVLSALRHPAIVRYVAHGTFEGALYLSMEWLEGQDLAAHLTRGHLSVSETVTLARRVTEALAVAHEREIVHRDIKPANIFLPSDVLGHAKLLDFGVARITRSTRTTRTGMTVGTPGYMAPEQARGAKDLDGRADIFALGCVLVECLTGQEAFSGRDVTAVLAKILFAEPPRLRELMNDIPLEIDDLVARMLAKDPAMRPASSRALIAELDALVSLHSGGPPGSSRRRSFAVDEQRYVSVVVVAAARPFEAGRFEAGRVEAGPFEDGLVMELGPSGNTHGSDLALRARLEPFGARFERLADGSAVVALAGAAPARDQATLAARCALVLREALPRVPIVLATGRAVTRGTALPVGEVIERAVADLRAARVHDAAPSSPSFQAQPIRLDETTGQLLRGHFDVVREAGGFVLRGEKRGAEAARSLLGRESPFAGREAEIALLDAVLAECEVDRVAKAVLVTATAGVGKSRLRREWLRRLAMRRSPPLVLVGRGDLARAAIGLAMLAELVHGATGVHDGMPLLERQERLAAHVSALLPAGEVQRVTELLGELIGAPFVDVWSPGLRAAREDASLLHAEMKRAWRDWLSAQSATRTVVLVLDDLEGADLSSLAFLDDALSTLEGLPLMLLALARPEVRERFPNLCRRLATLEVALGPLPREACEWFVREMLGGSIHEETVSLMLDRAAGNPFFLEELIRFEWEGEDVLPNTVLAVAQAQLDRLEPAARRVLRAGSVFGNTFCRGGVAAMLGVEAESKELAYSLELLVAKEIITRRRHCQFPGDEAYAFRHSLVREAALAMLTGADRGMAESMAASWRARAGGAELEAAPEPFPQI